MIKSIVGKINLSFFIGFIFFILLISEKNFGLFSNLLSHKILFIYLIASAALALFYSFVDGYKQIIVDLFLSVSAAFLLYSIWPLMFFDDAGFILRYLENFSDGYFYSFNKSDGPVFGISGFIHGIFTGFLCYFHLSSPEQALRISNFLGYSMVSFFLLQSLRILVKSKFVSFLIWVCALSGAKMYLDVVYTGMETPLHMSFIMATCYFLLAKKSKSMWFFASLSIISKLDAVPAICVLAFIRIVEIFWQNGKFITNRNELKGFIFFFLFPIILWILFAFIVFGSPLPQSARAKMLYHTGANTEWFPFAQIFLKDWFKFPLLIWVGIMAVRNIILVIATKSIEPLKDFIFGWMFLSSMLLYYFYNPNERMLWYYSLPDFLLVLQSALSAALLLKSTKSFKGAIAGFSPLVLMLFLWPDVNGAKLWMNQYLDCLEKERYRAGFFIEEVSNEKDTLLAFHGLPSRKFKGYVFDNTGLNSKLAVQYKLNTDSVIAELKPKFIFGHSNFKLLDIVNRYPYQIKEIFYDVSLENWPSWILWERNEIHGFTSSENLAIEADTIFDLPDLVYYEGDTINITLNAKLDSLSNGHLRFGLKRFADKKEIYCEKWYGTTGYVKSSLKIPGINEGNFVSSYTFPQEIPLKRAEFANAQLQRVRIFSKKNLEIIRIISPRLEIIK